MICTKAEDYIAVTFNDDSCLQSTYLNQITRMFAYAFVSQPQCVGVGTYMRAHTSVRVEESMWLSSVWSNSRVHDSISLKLLLEFQENFLSH